MPQPCYTNNNTCIRSGGVALKRVLCIIILCCFLLVCSVCTAESDNASSMPNELAEYLAQSERDTPRLVADLVNLWEDNGIYIELPAKELGSRTKEKQSWDRYIIGDDFEILYSIYYNGTGDVITVEMPSSYKPLRVSLMADMPLEEAEELYDSLVYNVIDYEAKREVGLLDIYLLDLGYKTTLQVFRAYTEDGIVFPNG